MTSLRSRTLWSAAVAAVIVGLLVLADQEPDYSKIQVSTVADLERELGHLRERLDLPGMSAVIAVGHRVVWAHGFGWASLEGRVPVDAYTTIFHLASVTKPYTATVVLQLADEGRLDLNSPVSRFGVDMPEAVHVWHLLSHTSGGTLGTLFRYDARAFGALTTVVEKTSGRPFAAALTDRIIRHLVSNIRARTHERSTGPGVEGRSPSACCVTFVVLANSDGLSRRRRLGDHGNVLASPAAVLFLNWYSIGTAVEHRGLARLAADGGRYDHEPPRLKPGVRLTAKLHEG